MTALTIRGGLRKLDFKPEQVPHSDGTTHVVVEFVQSTKLTPHQIVRINLGIRDGIERILEGCPRLVRPAAGGDAENLYRLEGTIP